MGKRKLAVGVDISKDDFQVCIKEKANDNSVKIKGSRSFSNNGKGFVELAEWVSKREQTDSKVVYIMEATGTYYEDLAYFLHEKGCVVSVVLANKIKHFAKSLNLKTKTDKVDAAMIAGIGMERDFPEWKPMSKDFKELRDLCREMLSLKKEKSRAKCQLHAMEYSHEKTTSVLNIKENQIEFYENSIQEIELEIKRIINADPEFKARIEKIAKVKGLGLITIVIVLCETNGFELFNSIRQVVSYSGLDIQMKESGNFKGKTRISKKGNARIRQCLFMPALTATMHNEKIKNLYERINERNPDIKKKGVVAGMRKLLILIFVLWKKNEEYNPQYQWN
jgi:transposase